MKDNRKVKFFNEVEYNKVITNLKASLPLAQELKKLMQGFNGLASLEEVDNFLNAKTNFKNAEFSADGLGLKADYLRFKELVRIVDLCNYNNLLTSVADEVAAKVREAHTKYYTVEESKAIKKVETILKQLNELDVPERSSISINRVSQFVFSPRLFVTKTKRR